MILKKLQLSKRAFKSNMPWNLPILEEIEGLVRVPPRLGWISTDYPRPAMVQDPCSDDL
jgi:hypothetical protein